MPLEPNQLGECTILLTIVNIILEWHSYLRNFPLKSVFPTLSKSANIKRLLRTSSKRTVFFGQWFGGGALTRY